MEDVGHKEVLGYVTDLVGSNSEAGDEGGEGDDYDVQRYRRLIIRRQSQTEESGPGR